MNKRLFLLISFVCIEIISIYYMSNWQFIEAKCDEDKMNIYGKNWAMTHYTDVCDVSKVPISQWLTQISGIGSFFGILISLGLWIDGIKDKTKPRQTDLQEFNKQNPTSDNQ